MTGVVLNTLHVRLEYINSLKEWRAVSAMQWSPCC